MTACSRCQTRIEDGDLRCAICALPVPVAAGAGVTSSGLSGERTIAQVLRCGDCGAAVAFVAAARAPRCGFCGATMAIEQPVDPIEQAELHLPFAVDHDAAAVALRGWLANRGWFAPRSLAGEAVLESLTPLSWAAWRINAIARVSWSADSDAGAARSAWAPHAGQVELGFSDIIVPASRGLGGAEARMLVPYYDLSNPVPIARGTDPAGGAWIESFDAQRSAARAYVQDRLNAAARVRVERHIPGVRFRNVQVSCLLERQTTERLALPAWVLAYRYRGAAYRAIVHGQRAEIVIGRSPLDRGKVAWLIATLALIAAIIVVIALQSR